MKRNRSQIIKLSFSTAIFILSFFIMIGAGVYKKTLSNEKANFKAVLQQKEINEKLNPIVFDIQQQGLPKKIIQPGKISITSGHGGGITNKSDGPIWVDVKASGFNGNVNIESADPSFDEKANKFLEPILPGDSVSLDINVEIPRKSIHNNHLVSTGNIIFTNSKNSKLLAVVPIKIINSKIHKKN